MATAKAKDPTTSSIPAATTAEEYANTVVDAEASVAPRRFFTIQIGRAHV